MSAISAMPAEIVQWLREQEPLSAISFMTEYPARKKAIPLKSAIVAVGIQSVNLTDSFVENDEGVLEENEYCRVATIRIKLGIHVPFSQGGAMCHSVFTDIMDCLTFATDLRITKSGCNNVAADRDTDAFVLEGYIDITADFCPAQSTDIRFASFMNKELLCGSHISNAALHFTAEEKERFSAPFVSGSYFGTGAATRSIALAFTPSVVLVFAVDLPPVMANFSAGTALAYWGIATAGGQTQGIELGSKSFRLLSASSQTIGTSSPRLNEAGTSYYYIAYK